MKEHKECLLRNCKYRKVREEKFSGKKSMAASLGPCPHLPTSEMQSTMLLLAWSAWQMQAVAAAATLLTGLVAALLQAAPRSARAVLGLGLHMSDPPGHSMLIHSCTQMLGVLVCHMCNMCH